MEIQSAVDSNTAASTVQLPPNEESKLNKITEDLEKFNNKLQSLEDHIKKQIPNSSVNMNMNQQMTFIMDEIQERERRKKSVMFFNVKESDADAIEERVQHDTNLVKSLCADTMDLSNEIKKVARVGARKAGGRRPLRIDLINESACKTLLYDATKISEKSEGPGGEKVSLSKDRTLIERQERQSLVAEMKKKREETLAKNGQEKWVIRGNRVIDLTNPLRI